MNFVSDKEGQDWRILVGVVFWWSAFSIFQGLGDYKDSLLQVANITLDLKSEMEERIYNAALQYYESEEYTLALAELAKIENYEGSAEFKIKCQDELWRKNRGILLLQV